MTKDLLEKLSQPKGVLSVSDLTPDEKQRLYALFIEYGATQGLAYDRVFKEGFDEWEITGIDDIKRKFLNDHDAELGNYERILALSATEKGKFYAILGENKGLKTELKTLMSDMGMSPVTCQTRFTDDNWKVWEKVGVKYIIEEFINRESDERHFL